MSIYYRFCSKVQLKFVLWIVKLKFLLNLVTVFLVPAEAAECAVMMTCLLLCQV